MKYVVQEFSNEQTGESVTVTALSTEATLMMLRKQGGVVFRMVNDDMPPVCILCADNEQEMLEQINSIMQAHAEKYATL